MKILRSAIKKKNLTWEKNCFVLQDSGNTDVGSMWLSTIVCRRITGNCFTFIRRNRMSFGALCWRKLTRNCTDLTSRWKGVRRAKRWKISREALRRCTRWKKLRQIYSVFCSKRTKGIPWWVVRSRYEIESTRILIPSPQIRRKIYEFMGTFFSSRIQTS